MRAFRIVVAAAALVAAACGGSSEPPDVAGKELAFARGAMETAELEYDVAYEATDEAPAGTVIRVESAEGDNPEYVLVVAERPSKTLTGTFTLIDADVSGTPNNCYGTGGYDDIEAGMNVTVRDGEGNIVATTNTGAGTKDQRVACRFPFEVEVPVVEFYEIGVGRRGTLSYSYEELDDMDFEVGFTLG